MSLGRGMALTKASTLQEVNVRPHKTAHDVSASVATATRQTPTLERPFPCGTVRATPRPSVRNTVSASASLGSQARHPAAGRSGAAGDRTRHTDPSRPGTRPRTCQDVSILGPVPRRLSSGRTPASTAIFRGLWVGTSRAVLLRTGRLSWIVSAATSDAPSGAGTSGVVVLFLAPTRPGARPNRAPKATNPACTSLLTSAGKRGGPCRVADEVFDPDSEAFAAYRIAKDRSERLRAEWAALGEPTTALGGRSTR
ncbi:MAG: hypothetical protein QOJ13_403 [Gaiellales bacterium]|jgi:hypothetical protein|nr:hypothetical protein [Gaiellales bacterium]